ncbi:hypothetical protein [Rivularia sp. UHCC 0363]|uniref:hypothetical protein n=1 Tax=Rivularia sp. UHCC 0363 TaxID=3110244 RepID=UPI002B1EF13D|nr:hypothetical protein [Rivularia sp. UHCC 0363]MEA5598403.1 hypothetical protein [Rivularia sp. UHCC 0363]
MKKYFANSVFAIFTPNWKYGFSTLVLCMAIALPQFSGWVESQLPLSSYLFFGEGIVQDEMLMPVWRQLRDAYRTIPKNLPLSLSLISFSARIAFFLIKLHKLTALSPI